MCHKESLFLLFILLTLERSQGTFNYLKDTSKTAVQPKEEERNLEDESLWCDPEHVHLSYGKSVLDVTVTWATKGNCKMMVEFADHPWGLDKRADAKMVELNSKENNSLKYIHLAVLQNLSPLTTYYCRVKTLDQVGKHSFYFKTAGSNETVNFLLASSLDNKVTVMSISQEALTGQYSALLYTGDLEAKLNLNFDEPDDSFMVELEQFSEFLPVLTVPGKKSAQREDGLYLYRNMFSMPNTEWPTPADKLWYSLDLGPVHLISYSTGVLIDADSKMSKLQQDWIVNDLNQANKNRGVTPWVIALGSHPMYCAHGVKDVQDCALNTSKIRQGLEDIFYHFGVDLIIASRHSYYERLWPQYKGVVVGTSYQQPRAPVEVILGTFDGQREVREDAVNSTATPVDWSAFHLKEEAVNSFASLSMANASHLEWKLMSADGKTVLDSFWLVQDYHANFSLASLPHNVSHQINQTIIALGGKPGTYDFISGSTGDPTEGEGLSKYSLWMGLGILAAVFSLLLGVVAVRSCVRKSRRGRAGRRWREVDGQSGQGPFFYSAASDSDTDDNDFEIDVYDKSSKQSSKLLTSY